MKKNKRGFIVSAAIVLLIIIVLGVFLTFWRSSSHNKTEECDNGTYKLRDNVIVTSEKSGIKIDSLEDEILIYNSKQRLKEGTVLLSGISDTTPNGGIWVVQDSTKLEKEQYRSHVINGTFLDVFEEANIKLSIDISKNDIEGNITDKNNLLDIINPVMEVQAEEADPLISLTFGGDYEKEISKGIDITGTAQFSFTLNFQLVIQKGDMDLGLSLTDNLTSAASLKCTHSMVEKEFEKNIFKWIKPIEFAIGPVPVVVTNEIAGNVRGNVEVEGEISHTISLSKTYTTGFEYSSKTGKVTDICENKYNDDGMKWDAQVGVTTECAVGIYLDCTMKLYGVLGIRVSPGIESSFEGELVIQTGEEGGLKGTADAKILPVIQGTLVVDNVFTDKNLISQDLFAVEFKPLWEKHWELPENQLDKNEEKEVKQKDLEKEALEAYLNQQTSLSGQEYGTYLAISQNSGLGVDYMGDSFYYGRIGYILDDFDKDGEKELVTVEGSADGQLSLNLVGYNKELEESELQQTILLHGIETAANDYRAHWSLIKNEKKNYILYDYYIGYSAISDGYYRGFALYEINTDGLQEIVKWDHAGSEMDEEDENSGIAQIDRVFQIAGVEPRGEYDIAVEANFLDYLECSVFGKIWTTLDMEYSQISDWVNREHQPDKIRIATGHIE